MKSRNVILFLLCGCNSLGIAFSEVGVVHREVGCSQIIAQGNTSNPVPHRWESMIHLEPEFVLNPGGDANGDGEPDFGFGDPSGTPVPPTFVWARQVTPGNHDPVYAQFVGGAWTAPVVISSDPGDDLDPRWWQDATGTIHAVWWRHGADGANDSVLYARRISGAPGFTTEELVSLSSESARAPSLVVRPDGTVLVGYETDAGGGLKNIQVASKATLLSAFQPVVLASTPFPEATTPEAERTSSHVWTTWIDSPTRVGYSELINGIWSTPAFETYSSPEDLGRARMRIQSEVLSH